MAEAASQHESNQEAAAPNRLPSLPSDRSQRRSYDIVVEGLLARSKRVIPVVDDKSRHAMRWGILLEQPFGDQLLDSVVQSKSRSLPIMSSSPSGNAMH